MLCNILKNFSLGIAVYRLLLIKCPYWINGFGKFKTMLLIQAACFTLYLGTFKLIALGIKPKATFVYSCLHEGSSGHQDHVPTRHLVMSMIGLLTVAEMVIYGFISHELFMHDKLMRLILREEVIKQRFKRNVIDLFSHISRFVLELILITVIVTSTSLLHSLAWVAPMVFQNLLQLVQAVLHISLSDALRKEIKYFLDYCLKRELPQSLKADA